MKFNKNKRMFLAMYTAMMSAVMLTGFASSTEAQEQSAVESEVSTEPSDQEETLDDTQSAGDVGTDWCVSKEVIDVQSGMIENVKIAAVEAKIAYEAKLEEERRAEEMDDQREIRQKEENAALNSARIKEKSLDRRRNAAKQSSLARQSGTASNEMCTFLIVNISSLQLIPINMIAYRSQYGSVNPAAIAGPALLATIASTVAGVVFCKVMDRKKVDF